MSEPKLYRHNENGKIVAAVYKENDTGDKEYIRFDGTRILFDSGLVPKKFEEVYTPLPEAPEVGSTAWAVMMVEHGHKITNPSWDGVFLYYDGEVRRGGKGVIDTVGVISFRNDWELYEEPKPIVELLPHEFVRGQEVLWHGIKGGGWGEWTRATFVGLDENRTLNIYKIQHHNSISSEYYCIPYAENSYLEGTIAEGEHGAVPRGYVPPHVPKLGDETYWQKGDEVVCLAHNHEDVIEEISEQTLHLNMLSDFTLNGCYPWINGGMSMRVLYHKGSYVREDGTVYEHIPTRSHYITQK